MQPEEPIQRPMPTIAAAPYPFEFPLARTALIVIDLPREVIDLGGNAAGAGREGERTRAILPTLRRLLDGCRAAGLAIIHTRASPESLLPDERRAADPDLGTGAFYATDLPELLDRLQITHLLFAGVTTRVSVAATMREASERGYECLLVTDANVGPAPAPPRRRWWGGREPASPPVHEAVVGWTAGTDAVLTALPG